MSAPLVDTRGWQLGAFNPELAHERAQARRYAELAIRFYHETGQRAPRVMDRTKEAK